MCFASRLVRGRSIPILFHHFGIRVVFRSSNYISIFLILLIFVIIFRQHDRYVSVQNSIASLHVTLISATLFQSVNDQISMIRPGCMLIFSLIRYFAHLFNPYDRMAISWPLISISGSSKAIFTLSLLPREERDCFVWGSRLFFFLPFSQLFDLLDVITVVTILVKRNHR